MELKNRVFQKLMSKAHTKVPPKSGGTGLKARAAPMPAPTRAASMPAPLLPAHVW